MTRILFSITLYLIEFLIAFRYYKRMFDYKKTCKTSVTVLGLGYIALLVIYILFPNTEWLNVLSFALVNYITSVFSFQINQKTAVFHSMILTIIMYVTECITIFTVSALFDKSVIHYQNDFALLIIDAMLCKTLFFIFAEFISKIKRKDNTANDDGRYWFLLVIPVCSMCCILLIHYLLTQIQVPDLIGIISSLLSVALLLANIVVFWIYESNQKNSQRILELQMANQRNTLDLAYLRLLEEKNNSSAELIHDIKNHLSTINSIAESQDVSKYIEDVYGKVDKYSYIGKTSNKMLDLILNKYTTICKNRGIQFTIETFSENLGFMRDADLSTLLNNLLDNAIEAAELCENGKIDFILKRKDNGYRILDLKNSCCQKPITKNRKLLSSKKDSGYHGVGTKTIERMVKKYNGDIEWLYDETQKTFQVIILFP